MLKPSRATVITGAVAVGVFGVGAGVGGLVAGGSDEPVRNETMRLAAGTYQVDTPDTVPATGDKITICMVTTGDGRAIASQGGDCTPLPVLGAGAAQETPTEPAPDPGAPDDIPPSGEVNPPVPLPEPQPDETLPPDETWPPDETPPDETPPDQAPPDQEPGATPSPDDTLPPDQQPPDQEPLPEPGDPDPGEPVDPAPTSSAGPPGCVRAPSGALVGPALRPSGPEATGPSCPAPTTTVTATPYPSGRQTLTPVPTLTGSRTATPTRTTTRPPTDDLPVFRDPELLRRAYQALGMDGTTRYLDKNGVWDLTVAPPGTPKCKNYTAADLRQLRSPDSRPSTRAPLPTGVIPRDSCLWPAFIRWLLADPAQGQPSNWTKFTGLPDQEVEVEVRDPGQIEPRPDGITGT
ncbi:hypothetical protein [Streptosporangium sp. KLBMP 9127]|nr:hypothetical protein [Streptosporangium sp. KLBMP 9127]